jgi:hypothetical protein
LDEGALRGVLSISKVSIPKEVGMSRKAWAIGISAALAACVFGATARFSEDASPPQVRGTLDQVNGNTLTVKTRSGAETTVQLKDGGPVIAVTKVLLPCQSTASSKAWAAR